MKLYTTATSERGKPATKGGNREIVIDINIERVTIGRVGLKYDAINVPNYTVYFYPVSDTEGGRTLLFSK